MKEEDFLNYFSHDPEIAFNYVVDEYSGMIYNLALNMVFKKEDAEDLTQEIFIGVYKALPNFKGDSKLSTWIYSIALNKSREAIRTKFRLKRKGNLMELDDDEKNYGQLNVVNFDHPGVLLENKELADIFLSALEMLPENQRVAFTLHKLEGYSYQEITDNLDMSLSSVESLIFRAKKNLKNILSDYYEKFYR